MAKDGNTPLILAAENGTVEITTQLIKAGAAVERGYQEVVDSLEGAKTP